MPRRQSSSIIIFALTFLLLVLADQLSKFLALKYFISIVSYNSGAAFGLWRDSGNYRFFSIGLTLFTLFALIYVYRKKNDLVWPFLLVFSGALSNLLDRILRGKVVDFIDSKFWPSFNLADSMIVVGALWLILREIASTKNKD